MIKKIIDGETLKIQLNKQKAITKKVGWLISPFFKKIRKRCFFYI